MLVFLETSLEALLSGETFTVAALSFSREELVTRLWRFIESYVDLNVDDQTKGKEKAKRILGNSLRDCSEEEGHRVCIPGKL